MVIEMERCLDREKGSLTGNHSVVQMVLLKELLKDIRKDSPMDCP